MMQNMRVIKIVGIGVLLFGLILGWIFFRGFFQPNRAVIEMGKETVENVDEKSTLLEKNEEVELEKKEEKISSKASGQADETPKREMKSQEKSPEDKGDLKIVNKLVDFGHRNVSKRDIDTIVIHSSYDALGNDPFSVDGIIKEYQEYGVSAHYLIARDGSIYRLVEDKNIAYHAGVSQVPDGRRGVNDFSLGIELVNTKTDKFTAAQYDSLQKLINQLKNQYRIKYVLGHNQIAPGRKDDPWNFDWDQLN